MTKKITKDEAMANLPFIEDKDTFMAVNMAVWLILSRNKNLDGAIKSAKEKHNAKSAAEIKRLVKLAIPASFFKSRSKAAMPAHVRQAAATRHSKLNRMDNDAKRHVRDITKVKD